MKEFKTIDEQIEILKNRGLIFIDEEIAKKNLLRYGYYEIINGYKDFLLKPKNNPKDEDQYIETAQFENLFAIYELDQRIRNAVLDASLDFELTLKTALAYSIAKNYGHMECDYLDKENYKLGKLDNKNHLYELDKLFDKFDLILKSDKEPFSHYREDHGHIPPWILLKGCYLGNIKYFYTLQKSIIKTETASILLGIPKNYVQAIPETKNFLADLINITYKFRNQAAHNGRIYNYQTSKNFSMRYHEIFHSSRYMNISKEEYKNGYGKNDLYTLLISLSQLENFSPYIKLSIQLKLAISTHLQKYPQNREFLLKSIGVPPELMDEEIDYIFSVKNR